MAQMKGFHLRHERPPRQPWPALFWRPRFGAEEGCCRPDHAAFELQCRLNPGPVHLQQDLAVPLRLGLASPTQTLLRELAEVFGRCCHGALRTKNRTGARPVSQPPAPACEPLPVMKLDIPRSRPVR